jgi:hypothetical protein
MGIPACSSSSMPVKTGLETAADPVILVPDDLAEN